MSEESKSKYEITNDKLYAEIDAGIDRVKDRIIDELIMSDDELLLDDILDQVQEAMLRAEMQKKIYHSWIFEHTIPDEFIYDPGEDDEIEEDFDDDENPEFEKY